jgi:hypothetical protein
MLKTVDGGKKWKKVVSGTTASLSGIFFSTRSRDGPSEPMGRFAGAKTGKYLAFATR